MKATITKEGYLKVSAETELEAYALTKWCETESKKSNSCCDAVPPVIIETGLDNK